MPEGGNRTDISPSLIARVTQSMRYLIDPNKKPAWFGAGQPLIPQAQESTVGRRFDYPVYYNINQIPRAGEPISFASLRGLADNCDILRGVIETRKDQVERQDWLIRVKRIESESFKPKPTDEQKTRAAEITKFFMSPDKETDFAGWIRQILEDMFVIDAVSVYKRRDRVGRLYSLEVLDGATIMPLLNDDGRTPIAPNPAYQQILKGIPANDLTQPSIDGDVFTKDELIYKRHNPRSNKIYGYSQVEQIVLTVNVAIRRQLFQLDYYAEGSTPDSFGTLPKEWTNQQIVDFQTSFDAMLAGNSAMRRRLKFMPEAFKYQETKATPMADEYDEWLARLICFIFSISPQPFVKQMNRATADTAHEASLDEGLAPILKRLKSFINQIISTEFNSPDLEFAWEDDREQDAKLAAEIRQNDVKLGLRSIDDAREDMGEDPMGGAFAIPMVLTATGYVAIKSPEEQQADKDAESKRAQLNLQSQQEHEKNLMGSSDKTPEEKKDVADKLAKRKKKSVNKYLLHDHSLLNKHEH